MLPLEQRLQQSRAALDARACHISRVYVMLLKYGCLDLSMEVK